MRDEKEKERRSGRKNNGIKEQKGKEMGCRTEEIKKRKNQVEEQRRDGKNRQVKGCRVREEEMKKRKKRRERIRCCKERGEDWKQGKEL